MKRKLFSDLCATTSATLCAAAASVALPACGAGADEGTSVDPTTESATNESPTQPSAGTKEGIAPTAPRFTIDITSLRTHILAGSLGGGQEPGVDPPR